MTRALPWMLRRAAVLAMGQGPRTHAPLASFASAEILRQDDGGSFEGYGAEWVDRNKPEDTEAWPRQPLREPARRVVRLRGAGVFDDDGVIYERVSRRAVSECLDYWDRPASRHPALGLPRLRPAQRLSGRSAFIGGLGGQTFYHFLLETLPQLALLRGEVARADRLLVQGYQETAKEAWLRRAGVRSPIVWVNALDHFHCDELVFCTRPTRLYEPNPWCVQALQTLVALPGDAAPSRDLYLWADRSRSPARPTPWAAEVAKHLPSPWQAVDFGQRTPEETLLLCRRCAAFAGLHGAAFANLAFCPPGTRVLELYPEPNRAWYPTLSRICGHHHRVRVGQLAVDDVLAELQRQTVPAGQPQHAP